MERIPAADGQHIALHSSGSGPGIVVVHGGGDGARAAARAGDTARAMALTSAGINTHLAAAKLPLGVQVAICRLFLRTPIGRTMGDLLAMTLDESQQIRMHDGSAEQWAGVTAEVLLACGGSGPSYYARSNEALARALPRTRTLQIPHSGHDAINRARRRLVEPLAAFFAAPVTPHRTSTA